MSSYVLLAAGLMLVVAALASPRTRLEAAASGLLLIGLPLFALGCVLRGLDWMASYTATSEGTWDHDAKAPTARAASRGFERSRFDGNSISAAPSSRSGTGSRQRSRRAPLFGASQHSSAFAASVHDTPLVQSGPLAVENSAAKTALAAQTGVSAAPAAAAPVKRSVAAAPAPAAVVAPVPTPAPALAPAAVPAAAAPPPQPELKTGGMPGYLGRVDPGPDTVIEEFVGYEGQERMLVVRDAEQPPPRELAWPHPPRPAFEATALGNEAFLEKLTDDMLTKIGTPAAPPSPAPASSPAPPPPPAWTWQTLHNADHWRFAAMVEKLYQQAGFATQLQAGQTQRGVVVLWLFSRHRPGMPASVVSCVHGPSGYLAVEEINAVAELVKTHGLPRGQLATTATIDDAGRQLAVQHRVHLMDTQRLLELIHQRTVEQQRVLADRLA